MIKRPPARLIHAGRTAAPAREQGTGTSAFVPSTGVFSQPSTSTPYEVTITPALSLPHLSRESSPRTTDTEEPRPRTSSRPVKRPRPTRRVPPARGPPTGKWYGMVVMGFLSGPGVARRRRGFEKDVSCQVGSRSFFPFCLGVGVGVGVGGIVALWRWVRVRGIRLLVLETGPVPPFGCHSLDHSDDWEADLHIYQRKACFPRLLDHKNEEQRRSHFFSKPDKSLAQTRRHRPFQDAKREPPCPRGAGPRMKFPPAATPYQNARSKTAGDHRHLHSRPRLPRPRPLSQTCQNSHPPSRNTLLRHQVLISRG